MPINSQSNSFTRAVTGLLLASMLTPTISGCKRSEWSQRADEESYQAIAEKQNDERWILPRIDITPDPLSRFFDAYDNPDCQPLPPDDPAAHQFMHCADGITGYKKWHEHGDAPSIENISWLSPYTELVDSVNPVDGHATVEISMLTLNDAVNLAYIHSRAYQTQLESVYLQALQLTGQRYLLGTRFHLSPVGSGGGFFRARNGNRLSGTPTQSLTHGLGIQRLMPGGAQWAVDVLNTVTWNSTTNAVSAPSLAWQLTQPFMADGGRRVVMENLTQSERNLLYQIRDMARFRQTLFAVIASSYMRLQRQQQIIINQENNIRLLKEQIEIAEENDRFRQVTVSDRLLRFPEGAEIPEELRAHLRFDPAGFLIWTGDLPEERQQQLLAISDDHLFQAAARELIRYKDPDVVSQDVIELITRLNTSENSLQSARLALADQLDAFKIELGLPPNITLTVDTAFLAPFELIAPALVSLESSLKEFAKEHGPSLLPSPEDPGDIERVPPEFNALKVYVAELQSLKNQLRVSGVDRVKSDFQPITDILEATSDGRNLQNTGGRGFASEEERERVLEDVARDLKLFRINESDFELYASVVDLLNEILQYDSPDELLKAFDIDGNKSIGPSELPIGWSDLPIIGSAEQVDITIDEFFSEIRDAAISIREELLKISQGLQVLQAGLRVEAIVINRFTLPGSLETPDIEEVVRVGLANRRDLMNARAEVMDSRRDVEIAANKLLALMDLDVRGGADLDGGNSDITTSLNFKTPLDHVLQRNTYRAALIAYQRARRDYMLAEDRVKQEIRNSWRQLMVSEKQLGIDRQSVRNSARQYDTVVTNPTRTSSFNLLNALNSILSAGNGLVGDWVTYETNRLNIYRDMGIMQIDTDGVWEDDFYLLDGTSHEILPAPIELLPQPQSEISLP